ncbi:hypothetical protein Sinac_2302 [Singulisphaera acidiphila DSM 18658]|uniref:Uncharacterized protein n=1 Tax=Singulisphaera acidiphila (strain ATCC BAA-1392 / DSM 18658 / VKM B-2454 / MOB10) TaxID=886293 RepID=L0DCL9_SINAD|nr:hypothetical protein Sinac_2302 [Singulisphaera acidiphila DSM 18658]
MKIGLFKVFSIKQIQRLGLSSMHLILENFLNPELHY